MVQQVKTAAIKCEDLSLNPHSGKKEPFSESSPQSYTIHKPWDTHTKIIILFLLRIVNSTMMHSSMNEEKKLQRIQQNDNILQQTLSEFKSKPEWNKNVNTGYEKQNSIKR